MHAQESFDLLGVGAGPFNLSLLALAEKTKIKTVLVERANEINWHREISFDDSIMQTNFLKDLVTTVDPTNSYSFLNYLVKTGKIYLFLNTARNVVTRNEYENYLIWCAKKMENNIKYNHEVREIQLTKNGNLEVLCNKKSFTTKILSIATGVSARIPDFAKNQLSPTCFHAKSKEIQNLNLTDKNVVIIGSGQTGIEIFRNALKDKWGKVKSIKLIGQRSNLLPLDDSPFTNEFFTPQYVNCFYHMDTENKSKYLTEQKLASDGNTPAYLLDLYRDLYHYKYVLNEQRLIEIMPNRSVISIENESNHYHIHYTNNSSRKQHSVKSDIVIMATGFTTAIPDFLLSLDKYLAKDDLGRLDIDFNFRLKLKNIPTEFCSPHIYLQNHSRHLHGVSEPQTSLMPWRSATILNSIAKYLYDETLYSTNNELKNLINFCND